MKGVAADNSTETTEVGHRASRLFYAEANLIQINKSMEQAHPHSLLFKSLKTNRPSLSLTTRVSQLRLGHLAVAAAPYSVVGDNEEQLNAAAEAPSSEWARDVVVLKQAINIMTTVEVEEDEGAGSAGKTMISRSGIATLPSIFGQSGP